MQFGLVELRLAPVPQLATSGVGQDFIRLGGALPERTEDREIHISLVLEKVGHSVFRNRDVETAPLYRMTHTDHKVNFPPGPDETDDTMAVRVTQLVAGMLRPGEWLRGVQTAHFTGQAARIFRSSGTTAARIARKRPEVQILATTPDRKRITLLPPR